MPGYSKAPRQLWTDGRFRGLSRDARDLLLYLTTSPPTNSFGYFYLPDLYICHDLQWSEATLSGAWADLLPSGLALRDAPSEIVLLPEALAFAPESPNVVKTWKLTLSSLPRTPLLFTLAKQARRYLSQPWQLEWLPSLEPEAAQGTASEIPGPANPEATARLGQSVTEGMGKDAPEASGSVTDSLPEGLAKPSPLASLYPYPSPNPSPNPNPNPYPNAAASRAQGSSQQVSLESKTRPTPSPGKEHEQVDSVGPEVDTVSAQSGQGESYPVGRVDDTVPTPSGQGVAHRANTVSRPCQQGVAHGVDILNPNPSPSTNPNPAAAARAPTGSSQQVITETRSPPGTACRCYQSIWGFLPGQHEREVFDELEDKYPPDWLEAAFRECADSGNTCRNFKYLRRVLERWEVEGFKSPRKEKRNGGFQTAGRGAHRPGRRPVQPIELEEDGQD